MFASVSRGTVPNVLANFQDVPATGAKPPVGSGPRYRSFGVTLPIAALGVLLHAQAAMADRGKSPVSKKPLPGVTHRTHCDGHCWKIVGIVVGGVVAAAALAFGVYRLSRWMSGCCGQIRRSPARPQQQQQPAQAALQLSDPAAGAQADRPQLGWAAQMNPAHGQVGYGELV